MSESFAVPPVQIPVPTAMAFAIFDRLRVRYWSVAVAHPEKVIDTRAGVFLLQAERELYDRACGDLSQFLRTSALFSDEDEDDAGEKQGGAADA